MNPMVLHALSGHVERRAHRGAATANSPTSPHCAAVAVHRRHPHQSSEPPTVEGSEFGEFGQKGPSNGASDPWGGTEKFLASDPGRTFFDGRVEVLLDGSQLLP